MMLRKKGYTQREVANLLKVSRQTIVHQCNASKPDMIYLWAVHGLPENPTPRQKRLPKLKKRG